jgi:hypothetical protein
MESSIQDIFSLKIDTFGKKMGMNPTWYTDAASRVAVRIQGDITLMI